MKIMTKILSSCTSAAVPFAMGAAALGICATGLVAGLAPVPAMAATPSASVQLDQAVKALPFTGSTQAGAAECTRRGLVCPLHCADPTSL